MARPEAHFRSRATLEKGKKQIRAANAILNPHGIWADRTRVSNHKPRKGTETFCLGIALVDPPTFQITNPARGRKLPAALAMRPQALLVSNHKPRKGTETDKW